MGRGLCGCTLVGSCRGEGTEKQGGTEKLGEAGPHEASAFGRIAALDPCLRATTSLDPRLRATTSQGELKESTEEGAQHYTSSSC